MRDAPQKIESSSADLRQTARILSDFFDDARARQQQNRSLSVVGIAGFLAGVFLSVIVP